MLNLDQYINNTVDIVLKGKKYKIKEPSTRLLLEIEELEKDLNRENLREKRLETALILLNHNTEGHVFKREDIEEIPFEGIAALINEISSLRLKAESDPN